MHFIPPALIQVVHRVDLMHIVSYMARLDSNYDKKTTFS